MYALYPIINNALTYGAILGQIFIVVALILFLLKKDFLVKTVGKHGIAFAFGTAIIAMLGSLYYSDVALFTPCKLCWYQRILMYPLVFLFGSALVRKTRDIIPYGIFLSLIAVPIATYHSYIQLVQRSTGVDRCAVTGGASCSEVYFLHFGYITIPSLALTAFLMIITFLLLAVAYDKKVRN